MIPPKKPELSILESVNPASNVVRKFVLFDEFLSVAENCSSHSVSVPIFPFMSEEDVDIIIDLIGQVV